MDAIASSRKFFEGVDDAIEYDKIVDEFRGRDATVAREDEVAAIPKENGDYSGAEKFAHGMGKEIASVYAIERVADGFVEILEA